MLTNTGCLTFKNDQVSYQLLVDSRLSFIGCWLVMIPSSPINSARSKLSQHAPKQLFIFKDSIGGKDFSRLVNIIRQLE